MIKVIIIVPMIILGILFHYGKGAFLIAGYNTMSEDKKRLYNEKAFLKFISKIMFCLAFCFSLLLLSDFYCISWLKTISYILITLTFIFLIVYTNTGNRFIKK